MRGSAKLRPKCWRLIALRNPLIYKIHRFGWAWMGRRAYGKCQGNLGSKAAAQEVLMLLTVQKILQESPQLESL